MAANGLAELQEFEKLDSLLCQIPRKAQHGLLTSCDLVLTCLDANSLFIALGSNIGVIFLFSRKDHSMQRFKTSSLNDVITSVRLHHGIDDQLAFATASGDLYIYFFPGITSVQKKQIQKFEVKDIHKHYVTCLEWSTNGMKLFSGDKKGCVAATDVDFYTGQCASSLLLIESASEIVQLDYKHKVLLVSTRQLSFIIRLDKKCLRVNIGTQDRKIPGSFGACFLPGMCKTEDARLYVSRPGSRLWLSDINGVVLNTFIFADPVSPPVPEIPLLLAGKLQIGRADFQFGILKCFRGKDLVTWSNSALVVLDPETSRAVACQGRLSGIVDVAVVEETHEIFVLRRHAEARIIRIATKPEPKPLKADLVIPVAEVDRPVPSEDQVKDNPAHLFFKKLVIPLKNLEKSLVQDYMQMSDGAGGVQEAVVSPDLPPVVKLQSPELEKIRMFTGGADAAELSMSSSTEVEMAAGVSSDCSELPSPVNSSDGVTKGTVSASAKDEMDTGHASVGVDHDSRNLASAQPSVQEDSIVYSHKMKRHKKKKTQEASSSARTKDEDSVSVVSTSSQYSDETVTSASSGATSVNNPSASSLQNIDSVLTIVENLLNRGSQLSPADNGLTCLPDKLSSSPSNLSSSPIQLSESPLHLKNMTETDSVQVPSYKKEPAFPDSLARIVQTSCAVSDLSDFPSENSKFQNLSQGYTNLNSTNPNQFINKTQENVLSDFSSDSNSVEKHVASHDSKQNKNLVDAVIATSSDVKETTKDNVDAILESAFANAVKSLDITSESPTDSFISNRPSQQTTRTIGSELSLDDIYSEIHVIESSDPFGKGYKKQDPADDFYSIFLDTSPESPTSPVSKPPTSHPHPSEAERFMEMQDVVEQKLANTWSEFKTPANIYSLSVSNSHIWFTDKSENIYYSAVGTPKGIQWRKSTGQANQISVSPSGHIVWRLHRGVVYAGTKISSRHPEGLKWVDAVKNVATISVDNDCAWFVMNNGDVMMQKKLSAERPCYKSQKVDCPHRLTHISVRWGVVWAITESLGLLVRTGITQELREGTGWQLNTRKEPPYLFSHVALDTDNIGWALDVVGQIWFSDGVTRDEPLGTQRWWQVPVSEYVLQDETTLDMIKGLARKFDPKNLSYILSTNRGGLIGAGSQGVWVVMGFQNVLQVCLGNLQGYYWVEAQPAQMSSASTWKQVCAALSHLEWGLVWAQLNNGDVFTMKQARTEASMVMSNLDFSCMSVGPTAAWALCSNGTVYVRTGMGPECPQGTKWVELDISQLGDSQLVHISCNALYVWAVEREGMVFHRIGAKPPSENNLSPAWLAIDNSANIVVTRVYSGPLDWMVWAIDNRRLTYMRAGITESMPIGQDWVHVPGLQAIDMALTKTGVWALTPEGEVFFRYGVTKERPCGNYWKKIPGRFLKISASASDELWGIDSKGHLMQCSVQYLTRHLLTADHQHHQEARRNNSVCDDVDWEIV